MFVVLAVIGMLLVVASPFWLGTWLGVRRDDRLDRQEREDEVLDQYVGHGLPDR